MDRLLEIEGRCIPKEEDIVACKVVDVSSSLQEHQLWNNSNCLHPQGECPHDLFPTNTSAWGRHSPDMWLVRTNDVGCVQTPLLQIERPYTHRERYWKTKVPDSIYSFSLEVVSLFHYKMKRMWKVMLDLRHAQKWKVNSQELYTITAYLSEGELIVDQECESKTGRDEEVMPKRIVVPIIGATYCLVVSHVPHDREWSAEKDQLHHSVV